MFNKTSEENANRYAWSLHFNGMKRSSWFYERVVLFASQTTITLEKMTRSEDHLFESAGRQKSNIIRRFKMKPENLKGFEWTAQVGCDTAGWASLAI